jgi:hypothetical protein
MPWTAEEERQVTEAQPGQLRAVAAALGRTCNAVVHRRALDQNIARGDTLAGDLPPALEKRWGPHPWKVAAEAAGSRGDEA